MLRLAICALAVGFLLSLGSVPGGAADTETGYTSLFNGKDLSGWQYRVKKGENEPLEGKTETSDKRFTVTDGAIVANVGRGIKDLYTVREFGKNFHLKLEFRAGPKADSGVYIRGPQLQVRDYIRRGEQKQLTKFKNDDWNELDITVMDNTAICLCNGEPIGKLKIPANGPIGLQAETGKFEFRNIRIKELP